MLSLSVRSSTSLLAKSGASFLLPLLRSSAQVQVPIRSFPKKHRFSPIGSSMDSVRHASSAPVASFQLSPSCALKLQKGDITVWSVDGSTDAIVNAANERMLGGGGVDGAIHRAAGPELLEACKKVPEVRAAVRCPTGEARITPAFRLPVAYVIHTVGPIYDMDRHPDVSLRNAYKNSLKVAKENNVQYIAFPAISCGVYRFPYKEASRIAISTVKEFSDGLKEVHFVLFSDELYNIWLETAQELL
ncbi:O-acetyl-ADP-ribose deacetylase [Rhynchospora pubera]|uniref:O-acetyl-ADP-ribose deacetylase n=1 Tax=Rhynchospora pubera TaxID=906938 RepID=A0AAV8FI63_9POAL|nr:O-acetyl-ADP-ribose deacetylase [Rhynchospora pubera]